jgi:hypothetical protein
LPAGKTSDAFLPEPLPLRRRHVRGCQREDVSFLGGQMLGEPREQALQRRGQRLSFVLARSAAPGGQRGGHRSLHLGDAVVLARTKSAAAASSTEARVVSA